MHYKVEIAMKDVENQRSVIQWLEWDLESQKAFLKKLEYRLNQYVREYGFETYQS